jgi:hypothetical protein
LALGVPIERQSASQLQDDFKVPGIVGKGTCFGAASELMRNFISLPMIEPRQAQSTDLPYEISRVKHCRVAMGLEPDRSDGVF